MTEAQQQSLLNIESNLSSVGINIEKNMLNKVKKLEKSMKVKITEIEKNKLNFNDSSLKIQKIDDPTGLLNSQSWSWILYKHYIIKTGQHFSDGSARKESNSIVIIDTKKLEVKRVYIDLKNKSGYDFWFLFTLEINNDNLYVGGVFMDNPEADIIFNIFPEKIEEQTIIKIPMKDVLDAEKYIDLKNMETLWEEIYEGKTNDFFSLSPVAYGNGKIGEYIYFTGLSMSGSTKVIQINTLNYQVKKLLLPYSGTAGFFKINNKLSAISFNNSFKPIRLEINDYKNFKNIKEINLDGNLQDFYKGFQLNTNYMMLYHTKNNFVPSKIYDLNGKEVTPKNDFREIINCIIKLFYRERKIGRVVVGPEGPNTYYDSPSVLAYVKDEIYYHILRDGYLISLNLPEIEQN